jgi:biopolymer transport protein ExbB/TolQ
MQKLLSLGTECLEIRKAIDESKGIYLCSLIFLLLLLSRYFVFESIFLVILFIVSLANALSRVSSLETKLKTTTKALKEADEKHAKEVSAAKLSIDQAIKEVDTRAIKAKKALAEVSQRQASREEAVVK